MKKSPLDRGLKIYRENGLSSLAKTSYLHVHRMLAERGLVQNLPYQDIKRTDSDFRWQIIESHIDTKDDWALDIGCAGGFFSSKLAEEGIVTVGLDNNKNRIRTARNKWSDVENTSFMQFQATPQSISKIPNFDVILLLTVYHHWRGSFGRESSEDMLREIATKSRKIFFEAPGKSHQDPSTIGDREFNNTESVAEYYKKYLDTIFENKVDIEFLGETEYSVHSDRKDPVFLLRCGDYSKYAHP